MSYKTLRNRHENNGFNREDGFCNFAGNLPDVVIRTYPAGIDTTCDISRDGFAELARLAFSTQDNLADGGEKYVAYFEQMFGQHYCSNAVVRLEGGDTSIEATTNSDGKFLFEQIPPGDYILSALAPSSNAENKEATGHTQIVISPTHPQFNFSNVKIDAHAITAKGRVVTAEGEPVPNATVAAIQYIHDDIINGRSVRANHISTVTDANGHYNLSGILPENVLKLASYFSGGNLSMWYELEVHALGKIATSMRFVPLSEELLYPVQDLALLFSLFSENRKNVELLHSTRPAPPKSEGNVIFVEDIVMERIPEMDKGRTGTE